MVPGNDSKSSVRVGNCCIYIDFDPAQRRLGGGGDQAVGHAEVKLGCLPARSLEHSRNLCCTDWVDLGILT